MRPQVDKCLIRQSKTQWHKERNLGREHFSSQRDKNKTEKSASQHGKTSSDARQSSKNPQGKKKSAIEIHVLKDEGKCFFCQEKGHMVKNCPKKRKRDADEDKDTKGKKSKPSIGLVPDMIVENAINDFSELCRAWGKIRDETALVFFDPGARANFITPELASKLGIRADEMGPAEVKQEWLVLVTQSW